MLQCVEIKIVFCAKENCKKYPVNLRKNSRLEGYALHWDKRHSIYARKSIASRMQVQRQIVTMRYDGGKLQQHFLQFDKLMQEYRSAGALLEEVDVVCYLLISMGNAYSGAVTALETMSKDDIKLEFVKNRLLDEETKKGIELPTPSQSDAAFHGAKPPKKLKCFGCSKEGHRVADCPEKKPKPEQTKKKKKSKANVAESGEIAVAKDGETIQAEHMGTVKVVSIVNGKRVDCTIKDALYVPKLRCNLFSVLRVEQAGLRVVFEAGKAKLYSGSQIVACATMKNKLYELNFLSRHGINDSSLFTCGRLRKGFELWHRRFGHLNEQSVWCKRKWCPDST